MSGHNKWSKIKHKKAKTDVQKGKAFSKMGREITVAAKLGGMDESMNPRLRLAIQLARNVNMPNDTIKRAIQRAEGSDSAALQERLFEAYWLHGIALLITTLSDNNNRTVSNIKTILGKAGGSLATKGAVSYQFQRIGQLVVPSGDPDTVLDCATDHGADDVIVHDEGHIEVRCQPDHFMAIQQAFDATHIGYETAELTYVADTLMALDDTQAPGLLKLLDQLDDDDDVQHVYGNYDIPDDVYDALGVN